MIKLKIPSTDMPVGELFRICVEGFRNKAKVNRLLLYKDAVEMSARDYLKFIPFDVEHFPDYQIIITDKDDLISVYDEKFSNKSFKRVRDYYEEIRNSSGGKCAICNIGVASSLDHYLPKSEFPLLCVFPANLVPECDYCNKNKQTYFINKNDQMLLHPYFDDFSDIQWLEVRIIFADSIDFEYYNNYSENELIANRITQTIKKYKLGYLYSLQANSDMMDNVWLWKKTLREAGRNSLYNTINMTRISREKNDINSWSSALYRALENQCDELVAWLGET